MIIIVALQIIFVTLITWHLETILLRESDDIKYSVNLYLEGLRSKVPGVLPATNEKTVLGVMTNEKTVLGVMTNEKKVLRVMTNQRPVLHLPDLRQPGVRHHAVVHLRHRALARHEARVAECHPHLRSRLDTETILYFYV